MHYGFGKLTTHGTKAVGLWKYPGRKSYVTEEPVSKNGKPVVRKGQQLMRKIKHWYDAGEPELMVESRLETHHKQIIDYDGNMLKGQASGIERYPDYLDEELKKKGLA